MDRRTLRSVDDGSMALKMGLDELSRRRSDVSCELKRGRRGAVSDVLDVSVMEGDGRCCEGISPSGLRVRSIVVICCRKEVWQAADAANLAEAYDGLLQETFLRTWYERDAESQAP